MKIRNGFVSNSSSSSFVVAFPKKPDTAEDVKEMMFGKQEWHYAGYYSDTGDVPTKDIADAVFKEVEDKESASKLKVYKAIRHGYFDSYLLPELLPGSCSSWDETRDLKFPEDEKAIRAIWDKSEKTNDQRAMDIVNAFLGNHEDAFIATMWFADEDGSFWSMMEHSKIFGRLKHIKTSYH